jgi:hypothetical protein
MNDEKMKIYNLCREVPKEAQKEIGAGRLKGFTDINPMWRLKKLTEMFGPVGEGWYFEIVDKKIEQGIEKIYSCFVEIKLFYKLSSGEWSKPLLGFGGASFVASETKGLYQSDECYKMALTDAISTAVKLLGVGADIYFAKDRTKYDVTEEKAEKKAELKKPEEKKDPVKNERIALFNFLKKEVGIEKVATDEDKKNITNYCVTLMGGKNSVTELTEEEVKTYYKKYIADRELA